MVLDYGQPNMALLNSWGVMLVLHIYFDATAIKGQRISLVYCQHDYKSKCLTRLTHSKQPWEVTF